MYVQTCISSKFHFTHCQTYHVDHVCGSAKYFKISNVIKIKNYKRYSAKFLVCYFSFSEIAKDILPYYSQVKEIEKRDSVLTSTQQIDRLLRPGSTYFNLNPFEVLQIEPEATIEQIKKRYRQLSILVHPDKNQDNKERAQTAFEIINRAWTALENEVTRQKCLDVYEEAKARTDIMVSIYYLDLKTKCRKWCSARLLKY